MDRDFYKKELDKEGFKHIYEWADEPNTNYPIHSHKDRVVFYVLGGSIDVLVEGKEIKLKKGDRFETAPNQNHSAKVGPEGCTYLVGEMIEGDS